MVLSLNIGTEAGAVPGIFCGFFTSGLSYNSGWSSTTSVYILTFYSLFSKHLII
jgi:hypothetical protein